MGDPRYKHRLPDDDLVQVFYPSAPLQIHCAVSASFVRPLPEEAAQVQISHLHALMDMPTSLYLKQTLPTANSFKFSLQLAERIVALSLAIFVWQETQS